MSRAPSFLRPGHEVVRAAPWALSTPEGSVVLPDDLPDWDYDTVLSLHRTIVVDGVRARAESGLAADSSLALSVRWTAAESKLRGRVWQQPVPAADGATLAAEFDLAGAELGGVLELTLVLSMVEPGSGSTALAARRPGSVLWEDRFSVRLQGGSTHFPIAVADFETQPYPSDSAWFLQIGDDLEAAALGSLLLVVNERRPVVMEALAEASEPSAVSTAVMSVLWTDMLRGLLERALTDDDFDDRISYPQGSLGALLKAVLLDRFPSRDLESLRRERHQDPSLFTCRVQAAAGLLGGRR